MPLSSIFIRALWGDNIVERRAKVLGDAERTLRDEHQPAPVITYAYGRDNCDWLRARGVAATLVDEHPVVNFGDTPRRDPKANGQINYGWSMWRHKTAVMARALATHDEIVWLDWDAHLKKPLPEDFWDRLRQGAPIQMSLVSYHVRTCRWRGRHDTRSMPEGAFIYCRDPEIVDRANEVYAWPDRRWWTDQTVFAWVMDEMAGKLEPGSFSIDGYKADGFEPYCQRIYSQFHEPEEMVFRTGRGMPHKRWLKKRKALKLKSKS